MQGTVNNIPLLLNFTYISEKSHHWIINFLRAGTRTCYSLLVSHYQPNWASSRYSTIWKMGGGWVIELHKYTKDIECVFNWIMQCYSWEDLWNHLVKTVSFMRKETEVQKLGAFSKTSGEWMVETMLSVSTEGLETRPFFSLFCALSKQTPMPHFYCYTWTRFCWLPDL